MKKVQNRMIEEYEINPFTLMIQPIQYGGKIYSQIYELEDQFVSPFKPLDVIKRSCEYFGSSYAGRKEGTKNLTKITHKAPITIDPTSSIFFFPTASPTRAHCIWLSLLHVSSYMRTVSNQTSVVFRNQQQIEIDVSYSSFANQILRTSLLKTKLMQRIEETERKHRYAVSLSGVAEREAAAKYTML